MELKKAKIYRWKGANNIAAIEIKSSGGYNIIPLGFCYHMIYLYYNPVIPTGLYAYCLLPSLLHYQSCRDDIIVVKGIYNILKPLEG